MLPCLQHKTKVRRIDRSNQTKIK